MNNELFIIGIVAFSIFFFCEIVLAIVVRFFRKSFQWLILKNDLMPKFQKDTIEKFFHSKFHPVLGWCLYPNQRGTEKILSVGQVSKDFKMASYIINSLGSRTNPQHENLPVKIATFGDSFVFSRHVADSQTWQWYLSELTQGNVLNFGVGNYGFDQALLRYQIEAPKLNCDKIIIGIVPETICRIHSSWKHYYEYGNTLAFKPRFRLINNKLQLDSLPELRPEIFTAPSEELRAFISRDYFRKRKFEKEMIHFPYQFTLAKAEMRGYRLLYKLFKDKIFDGHEEAWEYLLSRNETWVHRLYRDPRSVQLFIHELRLFRESAEANGHDAYFLIMPYLHDILTFNKNGYSPFDNFISMARGTIPVLDFVSHACQQPNPAEWYINDLYGGHLSTTGNRALADFVYQSM